MKRISQIVRRMLGTPFRRDKRDAPPNVKYELLTTHQSKFLKFPINPSEPQEVEFNARAWETRDFVVSINGPVLLDTSLGWVMRGRTLLDIGNWGLVDQHPDPPKPALHRWLIAQLLSKRYDEVIWLPFGAGNYFHFFNDLISVLVLIGRPDVKVLVHESLCKKRFFREVIDGSTFLSSLNWVPYSSSRWIKARSVIGGGSVFGSWATLRRATATVDRLKSFQTIGSSRIFVTRRADTLRFPANLDEIRTMVEQEGFTTVDFEGLSVAEQRAIMIGADHIVALHGAGLTNLAFHDEPETLRLFEIFTSEGVNPCFGFIAQEAGMDYSASVHLKRSLTDPAYIEIEVEPLRDAIRAFFGSTTDQATASRAKKRRVEEQASAIIEGNGHGPR